LSSIRREFGEQWRFVGYALGIEHAVLNNIEYNSPNIEDRAFKMMADWIERSTDICYCKLISAMNNEHLVRGVEVLKEKIKLCK